MKITPQKGGKCKWTLIFQWIFGKYYRFKQRKVLIQFSWCLKINLEISPENADNKRSEKPNFVCYFQNNYLYLNKKIKIKKGTLKLLISLELIAH